MPRHLVRALWKTTLTPDKHQLGSSINGLPSSCFKAGHKYTCSSTHLFFSIFDEDCYHT